MEDMLFVAYDCCSSDTPTLTVARREAVRGIDKIRTVNIIKGDTAFGVYHYLTGGADLKSARDIPMEHHHTTVCECHDWGKVRVSICPNCLGCILTVEEEFPRFCDWCGQAIDWSK